MSTLTLPEMLVTESSNEGRGVYTVAVPAGRYYVGDPCYPFPNDGPMAQHWGDLLRSCAFFDADPSEEDEKTWGPWTGEPGPVGVVTVDGYRYEVLAFSTQYGDGGYTGSDGFEYGVDAGMIGLVPMGLVDRLGEDPEFVARVGTVMEATEVFECTRDAEGTLTFGTLTVPTGDPKCEDCGGRLDCNGNCSTCGCWDCGSTYCSGAGPNGGTCEYTDDDDEDDDDD